MRKPPQPVDRSGWTPKDRETAHKEEWDIFDSGSLDPPFQLRAFGLKFPSDEAVWHHVVRLAEAGSRLHRRALDFIRTNSPREAREIARITGAKG